MNLSNYPPGALYDDAAPWSSSDRPGSCVDSERINCDDPPIPTYVPSAANIAWRARLAATVKEIR